MKPRLAVLSPICLSTIIALLLAPFAQAEVKLPGIFGDHMVLQQDATLPVWGTADPKEEIRITLFSTERAVASLVAADENGKWATRLAPLDPNTTYTLKVVGKDNEVVIKDVLVGEVWLCSGQSNMAWTVSRSKDYEAEQAAAKLPQIRMFTTARVAAETPQENCPGEWVICSPETVGNFSATGYFFGRELHKQLKTPVGLINSSWGGTPVQAWTAIEDQREHDELDELLAGWDQQIKNYDPAQAEAKNKAALERWQAAVEKAKAAGKPNPRRPRPIADPRLSSHRPANLYNGMIAPIKPFAIRGAIWYQGESNAGRYPSHLYGLQLKTMILNWRRDWANDKMPFLWVQLPNFKTPQSEPVETDGWVIVQEQMLKTLAVPDTGMAITIDVGEANDIHPKNKQDVGKRLALWALGTPYQKEIVYSGPIYESMEKKNGAIVITFEHVGRGLSAKGDKVEGFVIAGGDQKFVWAEAKIEGDKVIVSSETVDDPQAVRYAWAPNPEQNLVNSAGLPASPFRTDDWALSQESKQ